MKHIFSFFLCISIGILAYSQNTKTTLSKIDTLKKHTLIVEVDSIDNQDVRKNNKEKEGKIVKSVLVNVQVVSDSTKSLISKVKDSIKLDSKKVFKKIIKDSSKFAKNTDSLSFTEKINNVFSKKAIKQDSVLSYLQLMEFAQKNHNNYNFANAISLYKKAKEATEDSLQIIKADENIAISENGLNMMNFCCHPVVIAKKKFALKDFYLYYQFNDGDWKPLPNSLDKKGDGSIVKSMYIPDNNNFIYFSKKDEDDIRNIYKTEKKDSVWTVPELIGEKLTTNADDIFPMLSNDGNALYFSSKGLYGVGGYDLYVSYWDSVHKEWGTPINLGFPYSSVANDYLYVNTSDGKYTIFASDRDCSKDSVYLYVLEYDTVPVRSKVENPKDLQELEELNIKESEKTYNKASNENIKDKNTKAYSILVSRVRGLKDSIRLFNTSMDKAREELANSSGTHRQELLNFIKSKEVLIGSLQDSLEASMKSVQDMEMQFLMKGIVIDTDKLQKKATSVNNQTVRHYAFYRHKEGDTLNIKTLQPKPSFDYSFKILPKGRFAENNALPPDIIYQIQLFTLSSRPNIDKLRGLSPVFEKKISSSKYIYSVGLFKTYKDVLSKLNKVKNLGFKTAFITAYKNGDRIAIRKAREEE